MGDGGGEDGITDEAHFLNYKETAASSRNQQPGLSSGAYCRLGVFPVRRRLTSHLLIYRVMLTQVVLMILGYFLTKVLTKAAESGLGKILFCPTLK